jgi:hypothetical protein
MTTSTDTTGSATADAVSAPLDLLLTEAAFGALNRLNPGGSGSSQSQLPPPDRIGAGGGWPARCGLDDRRAGLTVTIGTWVAGVGAAFAFLSPILGWPGTAVTGSDTSSNALFATLQQVAAAKAGLNPTLLVAANTSGGVVGKMISPQPPAGARRGGPVRA